MARDFYSEADDVGCRVTQEYPHEQPPLSFDKDVVNEQFEQPRLQQSDACREQGQSEYGAMELPM